MAALFSWKLTLVPMGGCCAAAWTLPPLAAGANVWGARASESSFARLPPVALNVRSAPRVVPARSVATIRKWYVTFGASPLIVADTARLRMPAPAPVSGVLEPYALVRPYSK